MAFDVALRFGYDGPTFPSYAKDPGQPRSVENVLEAALAHEGLDGSIVTGSRTDAGVSARVNVCRARFDRPHLEGLLQAVRPHLPPGLWVTGALPVAPTWNPRHAALRHYVLWHPASGDLEAARAACDAFVGTHDVRAFARVEPGRAPVRTVQRMEVAAEGDDCAFWRFDVQGPSFLWNQVRRMVGAAVAVAQGRATPEDVGAALSSGTPHPAFAPAAAEGLVLWDVVYPGLVWPDALQWRGLSAFQVAARARWAVAQGLSRLTGSA